MNEKPPKSNRPEIQKLLDSYKPRPISEVTLKPRTDYSTHPRVQKAFRRLLNYRKAQELQEQQAKNQSQKNTK
jgi:hypothetical protein